MATSGTILTTTTAKEIIQETLELLGALGEGELANAAQEASLLRTLRNLCVTWQADGLNLFAVTSMNIFLTPGKISYRIPEETVYGAERYDTNRVDTFAAAGATSLALVDDVPTTATAVGVVQIDGTMHFSTINGISANTFNLSVPLTSDVDEGSTAYTFIYTPLQRFMKAVHGSYREPSGTSIPMEQMSRNDYDTLTRKTSTGIPLQFYVDTQATYNEVFIWPTANRADQVVRLDVQRQLDSLTGVDVDIAFPAEWFLPLATNLAWVSSAKYGLPVDDTRRLEKLAGTFYEAASDFDFEWGTSVYLEPDHT